ncbi:MAG: protein TolQ [Alphaproteobacteria bacterium]|nr:protein TolQ [Rhodospirillaceae bacterium]MBB25021.1 protein TolQ [Geminicoccus sp.]MBL6772231.1 protein TolQ [Alphaproteobacteria bacterium]MEC8037412.1 protein TolQ [Pseudomonadota bacterium]MEC8274426.1 protein TolQ [Pseudomonadota bacterium]
MELSTSVSTASIFEIVLGAPLVVKFVMALLVFLSIWTWAIIVSKILLISRATREAAAFESSFWSGGNLDELYEKVGQNPKDPMQAVFAAGMREWRRTPAGLPSGSALSIAQRIDRAMMLTVARELGRMETQMIVLASIGTAAPFIGLFGTVWGVMNSFLGIAAAGNTTLAVVAPGIAEALLATALGLVAAIPASIAYNSFTTDLARYAGRLEDFSGEFGTILARQLEVKA